jgi:hypothetical protein
MYRSSSRRVVVTCTRPSPRSRVSFCTSFKSTQAKASPTGFRDVTGGAYPTEADGAGSSVGILGPKSPIFLLSIGKFLSGGVWSTTGVLAPQPIFSRNSGGRGLCCTTNLFRAQPLKLRTQETPTKTEKGRLSEAPSKASSNERGTRKSPNRRSLREEEISETSPLETPPPRISERISGYFLLAPRPVKTKITAGIEA